MVWRSPLKVNNSGWSYFICTSRARISRITVLNIRKLYLYFVYFKLYVYLGFERRPASPFGKWCARNVWKVSYYSTNLLIWRPLKLSHRDVVYGNVSRRRIPGRHIYQKMSADASCAVTSLSSANVSSCAKLLAQILFFCFHFCSGSEDKSGGLP